MFQVVELEVEPVPEALGVFSLTVDGRELQEAVQIIIFEIATPNFDSEGNWTGELASKDWFLASDPIPIVELEEVNLNEVAVDLKGRISLTIGGRVRDRLADILKNHSGKIDSVTIKVNGQQVAGPISLPVESDGAPSLVRPYPYKSARFEVPKQSKPNLGIESTWVASSDGGIQYLGNSITLWRNWRDLWGKERETPDDPQFDYSQLVSIGDFGVIKWPRATDPDGDEEVHYEAEIYDVLLAEPKQQGPITITHNYQVNFRSLVWRSSSPDRFNSLGMPEVEGLVGGKLYAIRVRGVGSDGLRSNWSPVWVFKR